MIGHGWRSCPNAAGGSARDSAQGQRRTGRYARPGPMKRERARCWQCSRPPPVPTAREFEGNYCALRPLRRPSPRIRDRPAGCTFPVLNYLARVSSSASSLIPKVISPIGTELTASNPLPVQSRDQYNTPGDRLPGWLSWPAPGDRRLSAPRSLSLGSSTSSALTSQESSPNPFTGSAMEPFCRWLVR